MLYACDVKLEDLHTVFESLANNSLLPEDISSAHHCCSHLPLLIGVNLGRSHQSRLTQQRFVISSSSELLWNAYIRGPRLDSNSSLELPPQALNSAGPGSVQCFTVSGHIIIHTMLSHRRLCGGRRAYSWMPLACFRRTAVCTKLCFVIGLSDSIQTRTRQFRVQRRFSYVQSS